MRQVNANSFNANRTAALRAASTRSAASIPDCLLSLRLPRREKARCGPFDVMQVADGTLYAGDKLFAKFIDETVLWHSFEFESYWPNLIIAAPADSN